MEAVVPFLKVPATGNLSKEVKIIWALFQTYLALNKTFKAKFKV